MNIKPLSVPSLRVNQRLSLGRPRRNETDSLDEIQTAQKDSQELRSPLAGSEKIPRTPPDGSRQITPSCLPTFSKAARTLSNCSSVWVAM